MSIEFCKHEGGCHDVAIGVSRWDRNLKPENRFCRKHYLSDAMGDTVLCEVVGVCEITDVRTQTGVGLGGKVELDPFQVNIAQLVYAGHVKVLDKPKATPKKPEQKPE